SPALTTAVRVGLREGALVVRFDGRDEGTVATLRGRDGPLWREDVYEVFLSPFDPPSVYYEFEVNPLGTIFDTRIESPEGRRETMRSDVSWSLTGFSGRSRVRDGRWSAVVTIPLAPLAPAGLPKTWRANFVRVDRGATDEFSAWSPTLADPPDFHVPAKLGFLDLL
ncbi:MAG TPA: carbohydrate-binding family 9-like protein, partial [Thermoanaerobaculia bacterium]|nr:carbohydrate-binding family 9-like protein [Thermoanaerobaculia bacterium]